MEENYRKKSSAGFRGGHYFVFTLAGWFTEIWKTRCARRKIQRNGKYIFTERLFVFTVENHIFDGNLTKMEFFLFKYVQTSFGWDFWTSQWKKKTKCEWNLIILHIILTRSIHLHINVSDVPRNCCVLRGVSENACFKCQLSEKLS